MITIVLSVLYIGFTITTIFLLGRLIRAFRLFRFNHTTTEARFLADLPSVSVCIPARNETHAMTQCLESVLASRYPKLEIIVLDDESADNTSYLIKSFAHAGVRFVAGAALPDAWLGKNFAYETLMKEASGSYILFLDVDTQIKPDTIGQLVAHVHSTQTKMLSVAPMRFDGRRSSVVLSTLRYFWELVFHTAHRPAASSALWMIHRHTLRDQLGGFLPIKDAVQPEVKLASHLTSVSAYRFLISSPLLGVHYEKKWSSQLETSRRLLYPKFMTVRGGAFTAILLFGFLLSPIVVIPLLALTSHYVLLALYALQMITYHGVYMVYTKKMWDKGWLFGVVIWPYVIVQEAVLFVQSFIGYKTDTITWKGRPVHTPRRSS